MIWRRPEHLSSKDCKNTLISSSTAQLKIPNSKLNYSVEYWDKVGSGIKIHLNMLEMHFYYLSFLKTQPETTRRTRKRNEDLTLSKLGDIFNHLASSISWQRVWKMVNALAEWEKVIPKYCKRGSKWGRFLSL